MTETDQVCEESLMMQKHHQWHLQEGYWPELNTFSPVLALKPHSCSTQTHLPSPYLTYIYLTSSPFSLNSHLPPFNLLFPPSGSRNYWPIPNLYTVPPYMWSFCLPKQVVYFKNTLIHLIPLWHLTYHQVFHTTILDNKHPYSKLSDVL